MYTQNKFTGYSSDHNIDEKDDKQPHLENNSLLYMPSVSDCLLDDTERIFSKVQESVRNMHTCEVRRYKRMGQYFSDISTSDAEIDVAKTAIDSSHIKPMKPLITVEEQNVRIANSQEVVIREPAGSVSDAKTIFNKRFYQRHSDKEIDSETSTTFVTDHNITRDTDSEMSTAFTSTSEMNFSARHKYSDTDFDDEVQTHTISVNTHVMLSSSKCFIYERPSKSGSVNWSSTIQEHYGQEIYSRDSDTVSIILSYGYTNMSASNQPVATENAPTNNDTHNFPCCNSQVHEAICLRQPSTAIFTANVEKNCTQHLSMNVIYDDVKYGENLSRPTSGGNFLVPDKNRKAPAVTFCSTFLTLCSNGKNDGSLSSEKAAKPVISGTFESGKPSAESSFNKIRLEQDPLIYKGKPQEGFSLNVSHETAGQMKRFASNEDQIVTKADQSKSLQVVRETEKSDLKATTKNYDNDKNAPLIKIDVATNKSSEFPGKGQIANQEKSQNVNQGKIQNVNQVKTQNANQGKSQNMNQGKSQNVNQGKSQNTNQVQESKVAVKMSRQNSAESIENGPLNQRTLQLRMESVESESGTSLSIGLKMETPTKEKLPVPAIKSSPGESSSTPNPSMVSNDGKDTSRMSIDTKDQFKGSNEVRNASRLSIDIKTETGVSNDTKNQSKVSTEVTDVSRVSTDTRDPLKGSKETRNASRLSIEIKTETEAPIEAKNPSRVSNEVRDTSRMSTDTKDPLKGSNEVKNASRLSIDIRTEAEASKDIKNPQKVSNEIKNSPKGTNNTKNPSKVPNDSKAVSKVPNEAKKEQGKVRKTKTPDNNYIELKDTDFRDKTKTPDDEMSRTMSNESISLQIELKSVSSQENYAVTVNVEMKKDNGNQDLEKEIEMMIDAMKKIESEVIKGIIDDSIEILSKKQKKPVGKAKDKPAEKTSRSANCFNSPVRRPPMPCVIPTENCQPSRCLQGRMATYGQMSDIDDYYRDQPFKKVDFFCPYSLITSNRLSKSEISIPVTVSPIDNIKPQSTIPDDKTNVNRCDKHCPIDCHPPPFGTRRSVSSHIERILTARDTSAPPMSHKPSSHAYEPQYIHQGSDLARMPHIRDEGIPNPFGYRKENLCYMPPVLCGTKEKQSSINKGPKLVRRSDDYLPSTTSESLSCTGCHSVIDRQNRNTHVSNCMNNCNNIITGNIKRKRNVIGKSKSKSNQSISINLCRKCIRRHRKVKIQTSQTMMPYQ